MHDLRPREWKAQLRQRAKDEAAGREDGVGRRVAPALGVGEEGGGVLVRAVAVGAQAMHVRAMGGQHHARPIRLRVHQPMLEEVVGQRAVVLEFHEVRGAFGGDERAHHLAHLASDAQGTLDVRMGDGAAVQSAMGEADQPIAIDEAADGVMDPWIMAEDGDRHAFSGEHLG